MLACIEFLTCNMYCDIMHRLFLEEIEPVVPLSWPIFAPILVDLQGLAKDFARVLQFLTTDEYSRYAEDVLGQVREYGAAANVMALDAPLVRPPGGSSRPAEVAPPSSSVD